VFRKQTGAFLDILAGLTALPGCGDTLQVSSSLITVSLKFALKSVKLFVAKSFHLD
jgi:hypothetical protein